MAGLHELYAHDTLVEYPFALPAPTRLEGREAVQRYFAAVAGVTSVAPRLVAWSAPALSSSTANSSNDPARTPHPRHPKEAA